MKLVKRQNNNSPFNEWTPLHHEINSLFDWVLPSFFNSAGCDAMSRAWVPEIDVYENKENVVIKVDVPGIDKKNLKASIRVDVLTISGEKKEIDDTKEGDFFRAERRFGVFERTIALPVYVDHAKARAEHKNGTLTLILPKKEVTSSKQISLDIK